MLREHMSQRDSETAMLASELRRAQVQPTAHSRDIYWAFTNEDCACCFESVLMQSRDLSLIHPNREYVGRTHRASCRRESACHGAAFGSNPER